MSGTRDEYGNTLVKLGRENKNIVVVDADLASSTRTSKFAKEFPERFFNIGVAEQDMIGTAAGLASAGKIPFASTFAIFATGRAWEQIRQSVCYANVNVKIVASHGGITVGPDGATHQCTEDIALMRILPNMKVIIPADGVEARKAVEAAASLKGPVYIRTSRSKFPVIYDDSYDFRIGQASVLKKGSDATIIASGIMVYKALTASSKLEEIGLNVGVVNMSTIKPIDEETIFRVAEESGAIVTAEEHSIIGGLGSAVAEVLSEKNPVVLKRIGIEDKFGLSGEAEELLERFGLTEGNIISTVQEVIKKKKK